MAENNELIGTVLDGCAQKVLEAFLGRELLLFDELPPSIPPTAIVCLVRRKTLRIVEVKQGKAKKLGWMLVH